MLNVEQIKYYKVLKQFIGFSIVGFLVTIGNASSLYLLLEVLKQNIYFSYCLVYVTFIAISYYLNARLVFKGKLTIKTTYLYYLIYLSGMGLGVMLLYFFGIILLVKDFYKTLMVIPITAIWNFLLIKQLFTKLDKTSI